MIPDGVALNDSSVELPPVPEEAVNGTDSGMPPPPPTMIINEPPPFPTVPPTPEKH